MILYRKGIFCLEAEWYGLRSSVSVRPALEMLKASDYHIQHIYRDVATAAELEHYLRKWFITRHRGFKVLWLAMHSRKGTLLPGDMRRPAERLSLDRLEEVLAGKCRGRVIHFGGCRTVALPPARIKRFLAVTKAAAISGFLEEVDWTESTLFEMAYLLELQKHPATPAGLRRVRAALRRAREGEFRSYGFVVHAAT
ncbi:MAG: hypothetical protein U0636_07505 [Phycisphaerales bacterium]